MMVIFGSRLGPCLPHRNALKRWRNQDQLCMHVMSLAIQDLIASSWAEGLSDMMERHVEGKEVEKENYVTDIFGHFWVMPWTLPSASQGIDMMEES